jgi:hypothetical protein
MVYSYVAVIRLVIDVARRTAEYASTSYILAVMFGWSFSNIVMVRTLNHIQGQL